MKHLTAIIGISCFVWGIIQVAAMLRGFTDVLGSFLGTIAALILGELPLIGTIFAIKGAVSRWDWSILQSIVFF